MDELWGLDDPITEAEIHGAIMEMPKGKASEPDGFSIEFYQVFWPIIKKDVIDLINHCFDANATSMRVLNKATITLLKKKKKNQGIADYRPISVINTIAKVIPKILANILQPHLKTQFYLIRRLL